MRQVAGVLLADARVGFAELVLEVVVLAAGCGGGGEVEHLAVLRDQHVARLRGAFRDHRIEAVHQVGAGVDVIVAAQNQVHAGLGQFRRELLAQAHHVGVGVVGALGERGLVDAHHHPVRVGAVGGDCVVDKLRVRINVGCARAVAVEADEQDVVVVEEVVGAGAVFVGQEVGVLEVAVRRVGFVVAFQHRQAVLLQRLRSGELLELLDRCAPTFSLVAQVHEECGIRVFAGGDVDSFVPCCGLLGDLRVDADLRVGHGQEVPGVGISAGGEGSLLAPAAVVVAYAVDVLRVRLKAGHLRLVRVEDRRVVLATRGLDAGDVVRIVRRPVLQVLQLVGLGLPCQVGLGGVGADAEHDAADLGVDRVRSHSGGHRCEQGDNDGGGNSAAAQGTVGTQEIHVCPLKSPAFNRRLQVIGHLGELNMNFR